VVISYKCFGNTKIIKIKKIFLFCATFFVHFSYIYGTIAEDKIYVQKKLVTKLKCKRKKEIKKMKKIATILLAAMLTLCLVGCGNGNKGTASVEITDAAEILTTVWATYGEEEMFPVGGGDSEHLSMEGPAAFDVAKAEEMDALLCFPADKASMIDNAASMMHMMNANTFTGGAYHVADAANIATVSDAIKERVMNNHWMCGFPETLVIVQVGDDYLVSAYGNGQLIETFKAKLQAAYEGATEVLVEESLM